MCTFVSYLSWENVMLDYVAWFFGGFFLTNAIPHLVSGMTGRAFPTPFGRPFGRGESSAVLNVLWSAPNLVFGYLLVFKVGNFDVRALDNAGCVGLGGVALALFLAMTAGPLYGGNRPQSFEDLRSNGPKLRLDE
jgi:hypothetical protein